MDQQEFVLEIENKTNFLHVRTSGVRSREAVKNLTIKVFNTALENRTPKVLIDVRELFGYFGFMDIIYFVREVLHDLRGKGVDQVAVIDVQWSIGRVWFLEPVAQSHGINIRVFAEEESALKWLGEKEVP
jgi:hypothetical protein